MLVICEDCAKKYNIDESRIRGNRARFTCNECGHIIIVDKSDLSRPLIKQSSQHISPSSSVDLLKEMEKSLASDLTNEENSFEQQNETSDSITHENVTTAKGLAITTYLIIAGIITFIIVNGGVAFILSQHYSNIGSQQMELHSGLLMTSVIVLLSSWAVSFGILFGIGKYLSRAVNNLAATIKKINHGEEKVDIAVKGPKEIANIAQIISALYYGKIKVGDVSRS